jgi:hypothetical protein
MKRINSFLFVYVLLVLSTNPMLTLASHATIGPHGDPAPSHAMLIGFLAGLIIRLVTRRLSG